MSARSYMRKWLEIQERKGGDYYCLEGDYPRGGVTTLPPTKRWSTVYAYDLDADEADDDQHDNEADGLRRCTDCKGSGWYIGATVREHCKTCDGSGWL